VIPTVELDSGIWRVSIAVDVGQSRAGSPPPDEVAREDLVVELIAPADGSLEPIASPDPGPLPVRAMRVLQARGEFTFAPGGNAASQLTVALRGDRKTFPMSDTFKRTRCLKREPAEGGPFSGSAASGNVVVRALQQIPSLLKPGCCVRRFEAPATFIADQAVKNEFFEVEADFTDRGRSCRCRCCEYRQYVRGTFSDGAGGHVRFDMPSGPLNPREFCEDGSVDEFGPGRHGFYGHRDTSSPGDEYSGSSAHAGCNYRGSETASCPPAEGVHLEYLGLIVDRCKGKVVEKRKWTVNL
jgi:hypothetical protein